MINYGLLQEASDYYESIGYPRVESPWLVTEAISNITKPMSATNYYVTKEYRGDYKKVFVASGEQSFLYLINKGFLPKSGKYHTITPCMRNDSFDDKHSKYFIKLELINYTTDLGHKFTLNDVENMVNDALTFFNKHVKNKNGLVLQEQEFSMDLYPMDIMYDVDDYESVEIGSYGSRSCSFCKWVYGTGLAEPRFSRFTKI